MTLAHVNYFHQPLFLKDFNYVYYCLASQCLLMILSKFMHKLLLIYFVIPILSNEFDFK